MKINLKIIRKTRNDPLPWEGVSVRSHVWGHAVVPCLGPRSGPMFGATQWSHAWGHAVVPCLGPRSGPMLGATRWPHAWGIFGHLLSLFWIIRQAAILHECFTPPLEIDYFCCPDAPVYSYVLHKKWTKSHNIGSIFNSKSHVALGPPQKPQV